MSLPPRPLFRRRTTGDGEAFNSRRQFLPIEFAELVDLQRDLAQTEASLGVTGDEGDFARTVMELSALVAHTLGLYQNLYARETYLGTAETGRSLVLHARRLAAEPDRGLAASGFAAFTIGEGLQGTLPAGFALASSPHGEVKAQTFETLGSLEVDAARNAALPVHRRRPARLVFEGAFGSFSLAGTGLNLAAGTPGILVRESDSTWEPVVIAAVVPDPDADTTTVEVALMEVSSTLVDADVPLAAPDGSPLFRFLAMPGERLHRFGWNADPVQFPPTVLRTAGNYPANPSNTAANPDYGYQVTREAGGGHRSGDLYLSEVAAVDLHAGLVIAYRDGLVQVLQVVEQESASVAFRRGETITYSVGVIDANNQPATVQQTSLLETQITGTVTYLRLAPPGGSVIARSAFKLQTPLFAGWRFEAAIPATEPNPAPVTAPLAVESDFGDFRPGGFVAFQALDGSFSQVVEVQSLAAAPDGRTELNWVEITPPPPDGWTLDNLRVLGNVGRVAHGESVEEVLGGSDGVTPFQRFELKRAPLTQLPSAGGADPAIEVRVDDVAWTRVEDFYHSGTTDRHYRIEIDEAQKASVIFGSGRQGAIPPSGKKHIRAVYRQGLGVDGNVAAEAAGRIKKAHPLVEHVMNPTPIYGGADPADLSNLRREATRHIATFDRAVSVQDHADLALLFPGVARASARPVAGGLEVVAATASGGLPPLAEVEAFLNARRDTMLPMRVVGPVAVEVFLDLEIEHDPRFLTENVRRAVQDALVDPQAPGMFTFAARRFGQAAHLSEVYDCVSRVRGVSYVEVTRFRIENDLGTRDVLQVNARQWLHLAPANLSLSITPGSAE
jgi:hypothetical protein